MASERARYPDVNKVSSRFQILIVLYRCSILCFTLILREAVVISDIHQTIRAQHFI